MGVSNFYRWISERYPCLNESLKEYQIPDFDNLYLDMNGIIHSCSHPNDENVHFRISEEKIFSDIFKFLEVLFHLIRPQKVFFLAIDGIAPRAKMNQQRGRRFRSAKEAECEVEKALKKGEVLPKGQRFDSNSITPGTQFMDNLQKQLEYFITKKISSDPLWQKTQVILSGHQVPGEGEHKIIEYIRFQRSQADYNAETRHCLYGLDADLMILGLSLHEPYFSLLREEVKFSGKKNDKKITTPKETTFDLLHLSLFREYLDLEFSAVKPKLKFPYDLEHIIDDWVLMGFLIGNDFIPSIPNFHIDKGVLPQIYSTYIEVLPLLDGYINESGHLNLPRFEKFLVRLALIDYQNFNEIQANVKRLKDRHGRKKLVEYECEEKPLAPLPPSDTASVRLAKSTEVCGSLKDDCGDLDEMAAEKPVDVSGCMSESGEETEPDVEKQAYEERESCVSDEDMQFQREFIAYKKNYYMKKMRFNEVDNGVIRSQSNGYILAIQWVLHYYYNGVCSWSWYYPHHYAPFISDVHDFAELNLKYDLGQPFLPYEQLLGVLPAASKALVPVAYHTLMSSRNSPIIDYYPTNFQTDLNGLRRKWQAVVLIPFIDEKRLIPAMKNCESGLSEQEKNRNRHGPLQVYVFCQEDLGESAAPAYFPRVPKNHCRCKEISRDAFVISSDLLVKGLHPKYNPDLYIPGFSSMRNLTFTGTLKKSHVLTLTQERVPDIKDIGKEYCGQTVYVNWPHLQEARVIAVANSECKYSFKMESYGDEGSANYKLDDKIRKISMVQEEWTLQEEGIRTRYANRWGVEIGPTHILIYATPMVGWKYVYNQHGQITLEKQWSPIPVPYAFQATVKELQVKDTIGHHFSTLDEVFTQNSICFMLGHPGYGLQGKVLADDNKLEVEICVEFIDIHEQEPDEIKLRPSQFNAEQRGWRSEEIDVTTLSHLVKLGAPKVMKRKPIVMKVRPHLLFKPDLMRGYAPPDPCANYQLLDRVVNIRQGYSVPIGLRGTIVGLNKASNVMDMKYEILFDQEFRHALPIKRLPHLPNRIYHLPVWAMINLTHGMRQHPGLRKRKIEEITPVLTAPENEPASRESPPFSISKKKL